MQSWSWTSSWQSCQVSWPGAWPGGHHHTPVRRGLGSPARYMVSGSSCHWCTWSSITCVLLDWGWPLPPQWPCNVGVALPEPELPTLCSLLSSLILLDSLVTFMLRPCPPTTLSLSLTPCFRTPSLPLCSLLSAADPGLLLIFYWLGDIAEDLANCSSSLLYCTAKCSKLKINYYFHALSYFLANINLVDSLFIFFSFLLWI